MSIFELFNGLVSLVHDSSMLDVAHASMQALLVLHQKENIEKWNPESPINTFWSISSQVLFSISQKLVQHQISNYTDVLKWLREILLLRNAFLLHYKESAYVGSNIPMAKHAQLKLEIVFFVYLWSIDVDSVKTAMSCFSLFCAEAEIRFGFDEMAVRQLLPNYQVYLELSATSNTITSGRNALQKKILSILRKIDHATQGNKQAWYDTFIYQQTLTKLLLSYPKNYSGSSGGSSSSARSDADSAYGGSGGSGGGSAGGLSGDAVSMGAGGSSGGGGGGSGGGSSLVHHHHHHHHRINKRRSGGNSNSSASGAGSSATSSMLSVNTTTSAVSSGGGGGGGGGGCGGSGSNNSGSVSVASGMVGGGVEGKSGVLSSGVSGGGGGGGSSAGGGGGGERGNVNMTNVASLQASSSATASGLSASSLNAAFNNQDHELDDILAEWANMTGFLSALGSVWLPNNRQHQYSQILKHSQHSFLNTVSSNSSSTGYLSIRFFIVFFNDFIFLKFS